MKIGSRLPAQSSSRHRPASGDKLFCRPTGGNFRRHRASAAAAGRRTFRLPRLSPDARHLLPAQNRIHKRLATACARFCPKPPLTDRFLNWSKQTLALGLPGEDEPLRLLWAMTLGWRTAFTGDIGEPFLRAGTMHMFAIDGLRIALISGMLVALLRVLQVSRAWCGADRHPGHLVLHRRHRLGTVRHPRLGDDDHRPRRLGAETAGRIAQLARRRRVHHFAVGAAPAFRGELSTFIFRRCSSSR